MKRMFQDRLRWFDPAPTTPSATTSKMKKTVFSIATLLAMTCACGSAHASNPLLGIIEGENWDLPVVPSASVFIQSGMIQQNQRYYDAAGYTTRNPTGGTSVIGLTRFVHIWSFKSMPSVGFLIEVFQPEESLPIGHGNTVSGLGDPFVHMLVYKNFFNNSLTLGVGNILSIPVGSNEVSSHAWLNAPNIVADYKVGKWGVDGTVAVGFLSKVSSGCTPQYGCAEPGDIYTGNVSVRYEVTPWFVPFVGYAVQTEDRGQFTNDASLQVPGNRENDVGAGARFKMGRLRWFSIWYYRSMGGSNTTKTNAIYLKFATPL